MENTNTPTVFIVDDMPDNLELLTNVLEDAGFQIAVARSGNEALQQIKHFFPDIILLDVIMPGMDGFETCRCLKENKATRDIPVIFMTALSETVNKVKGFDVGGVDYLTKPLELKEVLVRVNAHLTIRKLQQELQTRNACLQENNAQLRTEIAIRRQVEEALKASEERYRAVVEDQTGLICRFLHNGTLTFVNESYCRYFGKTPEELIGQQFLLHIPEEDQQLVKTHLGSLNKDQPVGTIEYRMIRPDGEIRWHQWTNRVIHDAQGDVREFQAVGRDITEYRQVEEELARYHEHLYDLVQERTTELIRSNNQLKLEIKDRKRAEKVLRKTLAQIERAKREWESTADSLAYVVFLLDRQGKIIRANRTVEHWNLGQVATLRGQKMHDLFHPDCPDHDCYFKKFLSQAWEDVSQGRASRCEAKDDLLQRCLSVQIRPISAKTQGDSTPSGSFAVGVIGDITKRKQAEEALRVSEQQYRLLAERMADGIVILREGKLVFVNNALASMLKYPSEQLTRLDPLNLLREDYRDPGRKRIEQIEGGSDVEPYWQIPCVTGEGQEIWVEVHYSAITWEGKPAILVTVKDITELKLREHKMEEERAQLERENLTLRATIQDRYKFGEIIGKSPAMQEVYQAVVQASASEASVLLCGESGTGKELIAHTIHQQSDRHDQAFVAVNCGAVPESLFEREFFGHRKGAFTGANRDKPGYFDRAHKGTLFLDEVGELSPLMQVKLLRALQDKEYTPVGDTIHKKADVRIITATNRDLTEQLRTGAIRKDFYYRIRVIVVNLPPLRNRREDIPLLIEFFLEHYSKKGEYSAIPGHIMDAMCNYEWPGNIRELQNEVQRYLTTGRLEFIGDRNIEPVTQRGMANVGFIPQGVSFNEAIEVFEKQLLAGALEQNRGHQGKTAEMLSIPPRTLYRKIRKYGLKSNRD